MKMPNFLFQFVPKFIYIFYRLIEFLKFIWMPIWKSVLKKRRKNSVEAWRIDRHFGRKKKKIRLSFQWQAKIEKEWILLTFKREIYIFSNASKKMENCCPLPIDHHTSKKELRWTRKNKRTSHFNKNKSVRASRFRFKFYHQWCECFFLLTMHVSDYHF